MNTQFRRVHWMSLVLLLLLFVPHITADEIVRETFSNETYYLVVELLDGDLAHLEFGALPVPDAVLWTTPMVAKTDYTGASSVTVTENTLETPDMRLEIDAESLCITSTDISREPDLLLTTMCPTLTDDGSQMTFTQAGTTDIYGLGEQFQLSGGANGNWVGQRRRAPSQFGNAMVPFQRGYVGNAQIPILYALGANTENYAIFLDDVYRQQWDFRANPFTVTTTNPVLRWYVLTGQDLPDLRRDYMELTGHPPVPPKQMFGLWVSEYGYEDWDELVDVMATLVVENFPLDGFVLDLQWFGGIDRNESQMGSITWDEENFSNPEATMRVLRDEYGLRIMLIEESYIAGTAENYEESAAQGVMVRECGTSDCDPVLFDTWWGQAGGMIDWTNPDVEMWWHDERRMPLIEDGIIGHWTDLGEPENFDPDGWYYGFPEFDLHSHADVHNVYNLFWSESIWEGYQRNGVETRPFIMSRSGTAGSQRYGVAMWSGDIATNMPSLETHMNAQMHMSLSGIDYFGSDIGGFHRAASDPVLANEVLYSVWLANSVLLDVPVRPHTMNLRNIFDTAPSVIGHTASNLANVRLRYALSPYLYTAAHNAYREAEPVFAPLVYYHQDDPNVREIGSQKMIGADMMMATVVGYDLNRLTVYLPAGGWFDIYTNEYFDSSGEWFEVPIVRQGLLRPPLFVREGAIIPQMVVPEVMTNMFGESVDGTVTNDLDVLIYAGDTESGSYTLIEDDGETIAYQAGEVREMTINYQREGDGWLVEIVASGSYASAPEQRTITVHIITQDGEISSSSDVWTVDSTLALVISADD